MTEGQPQTSFDESSSFDGEESNKSRKLLGMNSRIEIGSLNEDDQSSPDQSLDSSPKKVLTFYRSKTTALPLRAAGRMMRTEYNAAEPIQEVMEEDYDKDLPEN